MEIPNHDSLLAQPEAGMGAKPITENIASRGLADNPPILWPPGDKSQSSVGCVHDTRHT